MFVDRWYISMWGQKPNFLLPHLSSKVHEVATERKNTFSHSCMYVNVWVLHRVLTKDSLIVDQVEVDHSYRCPDTQQGQDNEPGEETAAAGTRVCLLPILIGWLGFSTICNQKTSYDVRVTCGFDMFPWKHSLIHSNKAMRAFKWHITHCLLVCMLCNQWYCQWSVINRLILLPL